MNGASSVHGPMLCVPTLIAFGSEQQRREFLPKIATGELLVTLGVTEPNAGTDTTKISLAATKVDGGWTLNGQKVWNSGSQYAQKVRVLTRPSTPSPRARKRDVL